MTPMTTDQGHNVSARATATWRWIQQSRLFRIIVWARWIISIGLTCIALLWSAYVLGQDISKNLTSDYKAVQEAQKSLVQDAQELRDNILNPHVALTLEVELKALNKKTLNTVASLGGLRAPSGRIEGAKHAYRDALEELLAVSNRVARGDIEGVGLILHNALQSVTNEAADFNNEISYFQGGMWPQLKAAVF